MVQFTFSHIYKFPFELCAHAHLTKYPTEKEKNIVGSEIIESRKSKPLLLIIRYYASLFVVTC